METTPRRDPLIFIVEDDLELGPTILEALAHGGYTARLFHDPLEAARAFEESDPKPDLLITDYVMPGMNGLELVQWCKALSPALRVIMASGHTDERIRRQFPVQPDLVLPKPFSVEHLLLVTRELLGPGTGSQSGCGAAWRRTQAMP